MDWNVIFSYLPRYRDALLLDEITAALDPEMVHEVFEVFRILRFL